MTLDRLVCANCAAPVNQGRCPVCRAHRARLQQSPWGAVHPMVLVSLLLLLVAAATARLVAAQPA